MSAKGQGDPGEDHASRVGAEIPCSDMKRTAAKKLIERYFYQLTEGCGNPHCGNQNCASSGKITNLTPNQAAAQAIQLFSQEARLCDGTQPSKVARTTLDPGTESLAKSLPVKNVNPTCSDEGTTLAECKKAICFLLDSLCQQTYATEDNTNPARTDNVPNSEVCISRAESISLKKSKEEISENRYSKVDTITLSPSSPTLTLKQDQLLNILRKHNIYIPKYNFKQNKKVNQCGQHKKLPKRIVKNKPKKKPREKKRSKITNKRATRYTQNSVKKLLILTLYLKHLEKERYTKILK